METLDQIAQKHGADKHSGLHDYCRFYEPLFEPWRDKPIKLLEIGVQFGPSMKTWLEYFKCAQIYGIDVVEAFVCHDPRYHFSVTDQGDSDQMRALASRNGPFDIVIDDGCHISTHIKISLDCLWPAIKSGGLYIIEDCFAAWHPYFKCAIDGVAFYKSFIDEVNQRGKDFYGRPDPTPPGTEFTLLEQTIDSVTFTNGLTILRKK